MVDPIEYRRAVARIAKRSGVSCCEVEDSYRAAVKKSAASAASLFLLNSVITLCRRNSPRRCSEIVLSSVSGMVRAKGKNRYYGYQRSRR